MLAFAIAGHHGGMPNASDLTSRLLEKDTLLGDARRDGLPKWIERQIVPPHPLWLKDRAQLSMWTRFVFSGLVDADFLDRYRSNLYSLGDLLQNLRFSRDHILGLPSSVHLLDGDLRSLIGNSGQHLRAIEAKGESATQEEKRFQADAGSSSRRRIPVRSPSHPALQ